MKLCYFSGGPLEPLHFCERQTLLLYSAEEWIQNEDFSFQINTASLKIQGRQLSPQTIGFTFTSLRNVKKKYLNACSMQLHTCEYTSELWVPGIDDSTVTKSQLLLTWSLESKGGHRQYPSRRRSQGVQNTPPQNMPLSCRIILSWRQWEVDKGNLYALPHSIGKSRRFLIIGDNSRLFAEMASEEPEKLALIFHSYPP